MKYVFSITFEFKSFYQTYFTWCLLWNIPSGMSCKQIAKAKLSPNFTDDSKPEPNSQTFREIMDSQTNRNNHSCF